jgi:hypothetical protein
MIDSNVMAQITGFNFSWNNQLVSFRQLGSRFIEQPQTGMRRIGFSCNAVFRLPPQSGNLGQGIPTGTSTTTILEIIKNYLGYQSTTAFGSALYLRPALATGTSTGTTGDAASPQTATPPEKASVKLTFIGPWVDSSAVAHSKTSIINVQNCAIEGFGVPIQLESGLIEVPINFSVRGYPYVRTSDGSYGGHTDGSTASYVGYSPTFSWWFE